MLRNYQNVVRVFIYAPKDYRANKIMEMYGDSLGAARKASFALTMPGLPIIKVFPVRNGETRTATNCALMPRLVRTLPQI